MLKNLPTTIWVIGATVAVAAFSPVVGNTVTSAPVAAPPPAPAVTQTTPPQPPESAAPSQPVETVDTPPASQPVESAVPPADGEVVIKAGTTKLGPTAVDANGFTVYLSVLDGTDPPKSVCNSEQCLTAWVPVYVKSGQPLAGAGVDQAKLSTVVRRDKDVQATLGGWPLYRFVKDKKPGDVFGEGLKGTWHALSPEGKQAAAG
ncbi:COG4315 family predicted lipoprotein [Kribbella sp. NPDC055071]